MAVNAKTTRAVTRKAERAKAETVHETQANLAVALEKAFNMAPDDAVAVAEVVAERFAAAAEVNDETIDAEVRSLFYTLEARRLLSFRREEYDNADGQKRRAFWWRIRTDVLEQILAPEDLPENEDVYASLPADVWRRDEAANA
jgi:predicted ATPase